MMLGGGWGEDNLCWSAAFVTMSIPQVKFPPSAAGVSAITDKRSVGTGHGVSAITDKRSVGSGHGSPGRGVPQDPGDDLTPRGFEPNHNHAAARPATGRVGSKQRSLRGARATLGAGEWLQLYS